MKSLCVIPVYNEEKRLQELLEKVSIVKNDLKNLDFIIINNGSFDKSKEIISNFNLKSINLEKNFGVGYALIKGLEYALENNFEILVHLAGNGKMLPQEIETFLKKVENQYDFVNGSRFLPNANHKNNPKNRIFMIKILSFFISLVYGQKITDVTCGFRAFKVKIFKNYINLFNQKRFFTYRYEYYTYGKILKNKKYNCIEIPITMDYPKNDYSKIRPVIDWIPIISGWLEAKFDGKEI